MIKIVEVTNKKMLKEFIEFPNTIYKDCPYYVPSFYSDEYNHMHPKKNPARAYCDVIMYLAYNEKGEIVGRTAGIINKAFNRDKNVKQARFNRIDFIDDIEVAKALLDAIEKWALDNGMNEVIGPIGFTDLDKQGLLIDGFDEMDMFITLYHYPYYQKHIESLGYEKDVDWVEYKIRTDTITDEQAKRAERLAKVVEKRYGYTLWKPKWRFGLKKKGREMFKIYNEAFDKLYGFQPIPDDVMNFYISQVILIVNLDYCWFIHDKDENVVGFGLMLPSMSAVTKKYRGKLNMFNAFSYLKALQGKHDTLDMYFIAIKPELQNQGIPALIFDDAIKMVRKNKVKWALTGPELEWNTNVINLWQKYDSTNHRRRRCYTKNISE